MTCLFGHGEYKLGPELCNFLNYWRALGGGERVPVRRQLDLRRLTSVLRWMFILEMDSDGSLRFRLAGSSLEEMIGVGMTDKTYDSIFDNGRDRGLAEEIYALSIVRACGVLRSGTFTVDGDYFHELEVLALPFADERTMGGTVLVGAITPVNIENQSFEDRRKTLAINVDEMFLLPSPNLITPQQMPLRVTEVLRDYGIDLRALDMDKIFEHAEAGIMGHGQNLPSFNLEIAAAGVQEVIN